MEDKQTLKIELYSIKLDTYNKVITALQSFNRYISHIIFWSTAISALILLDYAGTYPDDLIPKDIVLVIVLICMVTMLLLVFSNIINEKLTATNILNIGLVLVCIILFAGLIPVIGSEYDTGDMLMVTIWGFYNLLIIYYTTYLLTFGILKAFIDYIITKNGDAT